MHSIPCAEFDLSITKGKRTYWGCTWLLTKLVKSCPLSPVLLILLKDKTVVLFQDMCACYSEIDRVCAYVLLCDCKINVIDHVGCMEGGGVLLSR